MAMATDPNRFTFHTSASLLINLREWDDQRSWEEFYGVYRELVYGFACRSGLSPAEAREATDEVFIRVAIALQEFDRNPGKGSFRGWLMNLTRTQVIETMKMRSQAPRILNGDSVKPESSAGHQEEKAPLLRKIFKAVPWNRIRLPL
jgi:DNA-directed RNA polymerase specialized sigma24 family protein